MTFFGLLCKFLWKVVYRTMGSINGEGEVDNRKGSVGAVSAGL